MRKNLSALSILIAASFMICSGQNYVWTQKADFGGGTRYGSFGFSISNSGYAGSGVGFSNPNWQWIYTDFWKYDQPNDSWVQLANHPSPCRKEASGFSIGNKGYVTVGWSSTNQLGTSMQYDPATNAWSSAANFGGSPRYTAAQFVIGNYAYVGTGFSPYTTDFWRYDPVNDVWTQVANIGGIPRQAAVGFSIGNFGYVFGGDQQFSSYTNQLWRYDPSTNSWAQMTSCPGAGRGASFAFAFNGKGFIGGGTNEVVTFQDFYEYDPATNSWTQRADYGGGPIMQPFYFSIGNRGYVGTGSSGFYPNINLTNDVWEWGPCEPASIITPSGPTTFCDIGSVTLIANTGAGLSYQWRRNGVNITGATASAYIVTSPSGNYDCIVSNSCASVASNVISVTVIPPPTAAITAAGSTTVCSPNTVTLNANTGNGLSYQWRLNGGNIPGATASTFSAAASGNYNCIVSNSCGNATSNTIGITVNYTPATPANITGQATGVCSSVRTYTINPVSGATGYTWTAPSGATISSGQGTTSVNVSFTSSFSSGSVSVAAINSCGASGTSSLAVTAVPAQPGTITGPASVCHNQNNVNYSIAAVTGATSYTWTVPPGAQIRNGQGTTLLKVRFGNSAGNITVRANNSCGQGPVRTLSIAMPCREGEEISANDFDVRLYPNPASDKLSVFCNRLSGNESILIFSAVGELIFKSELKNQQSGIDIHMLPDGMYFAEIISGEQKKIVKFIKQE